MVAVVLLVPCAVAVLFTTRTARAPPPEMSMDDDVSLLRRSYYRSVSRQDMEPADYPLAHSSLHAQRASLLGMHTLPVVYSSYPLLPQSQTVLDVWQQPDGFDPALEKFITLFERLLQSPPPWYYAHATMLEPGKARACGTLMRVANTKRTPDGRLQVLVQGLGRLRILNETTQEPFPRAEVQLMVDAEALLCEERGLAEERKRAGIGPLTASETRRLCLVRALARERAWWAFDAAGFSDDSGDMPGELISFNGSVSVEATITSADEHATSNSVEALAAWSEEGARAAAADAVYTWQGVGPDLFLEIAAAESAEAAAEQERCARVARLEQMSAPLVAALDELRRIGLSRPQELEMACWVELDALLRRCAALNAALPAEAQHQPPRVPKELLGLVPRELPSSLSPAATWPDGFSLPRMLRLADPRGEAEVVELYPTERRSTRLSFALAHVLAQLSAAGGAESADGRRAQGVPTAQEVLQELLETASTSDRLRLILRRMREARKSLDY